jgi:uncharacterized protein (DUF4415 family)
MAPRPVPKPKKPTNRDYAQADLDTVSDNPELTEDEMAKAKPFAEEFPELAASIRRTRGKQKTPTKQLISIRLDKAVLDAFKATGEGWQGRINEALRARAAALAKVTR